jgi:hypothetical protein
MYTRTSYKYNTLPFFKTLRYTHIEDTWTVQKKQRHLYIKYHEKGSTAHVHLQKQFRYILVTFYAHECICVWERDTHTNSLSNSLKHTSDLSEDRSTNTPDGSVESLFSLRESLPREGMPLNAFTGTTVIFLLLRSRRPAWVGHEPARTSGPPFMLPEKEQPPNVTDHSGAALPPTSIDLHRDKVWVCQCQLHTSTHAVPTSCWWSLKN